MEKGLVAGHVRDFGINAAAPRRFMARLPGSLPWLLDDEVFCVFPRGGSARTLFREFDLFGLAARQRPVLPCLALSQPHKICCRRSAIPRKLVIRLPSSSSLL